LDERDHVRGARGFLSVDVASFGGVAKEGCVPERWGGAPMPLPWVPREVLDEAGFEDPKDWGLLVSGLQLLADFEGRPKAFLR